VDPPVAKVVDANPHQGKEPAKFGVFCIDAGALAKHLIQVADDYPQRASLLVIRRSVGEGPISGQLAETIEHCRKQLANRHTALLSHGEDEAVVGRVERLTTFRRGRGMR
jgi:hypothetical protein